MSVSPWATTLALAALGRQIQQVAQHDPTPAHQFTLAGLLDAFGEHWSQVEPTALSQAPGQACQPAGAQLLADLTSAFADPRQGSVKPGFFAPGWQGIAPTPPLADAIARLRPRLPHVSDQLPAIAWPWILALSQRPGPRWQPDHAGIDPIWPAILAFGAPSIMAFWLDHPSVTPQWLNTLTLTPQEGTVALPLGEHHLGDPAWRALWRQHGVGAQTGRPHQPTLLFMTADPSAVANLVARGADPDTLNDEGWTADRYWANVAIQDGQAARLADYHAAVQAERTRLGRPTEQAHAAHQWDLLARNHEPADLSLDILATTPAVIGATGARPMGPLEWVARRGFAGKAFHRLYAHAAALREMANQAHHAGVPDWAMAHVALFLTTAKRSDPQVWGEGRYTPVQTQRLLVRAWVVHQAETPDVHALQTWVNQAAPWPAALSAHDQADDEALALHLVRNLKKAWPAHRSGEVADALTVLAQVAPDTLVWQAIRDLFTPLAGGFVQLPAWSGERWAAVLAHPALADAFAHITPVCPPLAELQAIGQAAVREHHLAQQPARAAPRPRVRS